MMWALVPVKKLAQSKQRLASVLDKAEREALVLAMLQDVLAAIRGVPAFEGILLVSRSRRVRALVGEWATDAFAESPGSDHSRAVTEANRYLIERHRAKSSLAISADIPRVSTADIEQIIDDHDRLTLVPNASGEGTNAILASPPNAIASRFGGPSLGRHVALAKAAGLCPSIVRNENIALDIDQPGDLLRVALDPTAGFTREFLQRRGIAERLIDRQVAGEPPPIPDSIVADQRI